MKARKKIRRTSKPKIRWDVLGLSDPSVAESTTSIDAVRKELTLLASRGFGEQTTIRSTGQRTKGRARDHRPDESRARRPGTPRTSQGEGSQASAGKA